ncbi:glyoxalase [Shewanella sp. NFH-SH190041]|uniref:VOC family protein n=1 Tax=Shewanella sp. NFH-SH190041 TaxID=2950245 RepID=UPI0021C3B123|nr:VOC family protein [Shewanella sp. NFH-SH190041]BDM62883.1 glyoxalase [Shewanella sp. NFH-SH190041]
MQAIQYQQGQPCWIELAAQSTETAKPFYAALFNWQLADIPLPDGAYTMFSIEGQNQGAMYQITAAMDFVQPGWNIYFAVDDIDAAVARALAAGGTVRLAPQQVGDAGRMAMLSDLEGAGFCLWQAGKHQGAASFGGSNSLCWVELACREPQKARQFYQAVLGWNIRVLEDGKQPYSELSQGDMTFGGILPMDEDWGDMPSHWMPYFSVSDSDAMLAMAQDLGASVCVPATDIEGVGRFAVINDPQGAPLSVITLSC